MIHILFVCMGNICRSPTAQGVFEATAARDGLAHAFRCDSAGTISAHAGEAPDPRAAAAAARGYDIAHQRARRVEPEDFLDFDLVLAMDRANKSALERIATGNARDKLHLFLDFAPDAGVREVPDPYYGGGDGFEHVLDICEAGARGLLEHLKLHNADRLKSARPEPDGA